MDSEKEPQITVKLLLLGDSTVGKTSILVKYINDKFDEGAIATVGVDYMDKIINYKNLKIKLQIWDTSGEEKFRAITRNFYRNADGIFIVFDLTKKPTFDHVKIWISEAHDHNDTIKLVLIGNKLDLKNEIEVSNELASSYAKRNNLKYFETSAKEDKRHKGKLCGNGVYVTPNINVAFDTIVDLLFAGKTEKDIISEFSQNNSSLSVNTDGENKKKKKSCC